MDESTVLLLDNNVTTFKTLSTSKSYLQKRGNKVYCAVAEVDYKNIYKWLLGKGEYEEMCHNWFDVIDAKPIMNYFSAWVPWCIKVLRQLCMPKTGFKYRQIVKLISLNEALINGSIDNRQLKDLAKKILNINKYKTVMLNELSINMMENGYDTIYINRIKELADLLYAEWSDYVTVSVSKIKRKRFDSPEAVTESIEKMEDEIVSITKGYIDFLEKDEGTDRENKKISNEIIFVEEGKIIFSITDGKTHNFWFEDKAPKYPLLKNCNDDKIFAKARILFNQESEENLYQAGIYVKSAEDKVYYMAIDNDRNCILDTIGENNRKEEFDNTNEYLIKMNLEADCLKVQFISDASTKELKMMIERLAPVEVGLMVKTWGNGGFLEVDFKESQAIISNK